MIRKNLLIHDVVLKKTQGDFFGESVEGELPVTRVRVEPRAAFNRGDNETEIGNLVVFVDAVNSHPNGLLIKAGDKLVYEGRDLRVIRVDSFYTTRLHHLELICEG